MTYSSIVYGLLTRTQPTAKTIDIKLPVPIIDAKTMFSFSVLKQLPVHNKKLLHQWLAF